MMLRSVSTTLVTNAIRASQRRSSADDVTKRANDSLVTAVAAEVIELVHQHGFVIAREDPEEASGDVLQEWKAGSTEQRQAVRVVMPELGLLLDRLEVEDFR